MSEPVNATALTVELSLMAGGLYALWRLYVSPTARSQTIPSLLSEWTIPAAEFGRFMLLVICAALTGNMVGAVLLKLRPVGPDTKAMVLTAWSHAGMLAGVAAFKFAAERVAVREMAVRARDFWNGAVVFAIALPLVTVVALAWHKLLGALGIPPEKQELVGMFVNARSPLLLALMIVLATVTAPLTEELVFRAGIFRFLRTRVPRAIALLAPSCLFAALHLNLASFAPLVALGMIFSLAYERTGRIATTIVAHALFNLHTVVLIFCGIGT